MYQSLEIPEKILSAAFIGNKIAIGTNHDCQLFQIEGDQYIFEKQLLDKKSDNLSTNKDQTLLAITPTELSTSFMYDSYNPNQELKRKIHLIDLFSQASNTFLPDNQLLVFDGTNLQLKNEAVGIKLFAHSKWLETVNHNLAHHSRENRFICHSKDSLYLVNYNPNRRTPALAYTIKTDFSTDYEDILVDFSRRIICIRDTKGAIILAKLEHGPWKCFFHKSIGEDQEKYTYFCFHPHQSYLLVTITDQGIIKFWDWQINECIMEIQLPRIETGILSALVNKISSYFCSSVSFLSFDASGERLLAIFNNRFFVIDKIPTQLLGIEKNFIQYKNICQLSTLYNIPQEIRWFLMRLLLTIANTSR